MAGSALAPLLGLANTAPLVAKRWLGSRWATPLDGGLKFVNDRPLLGASKTARGALVAIIATALGAPILGLPVAADAMLGAGAMLGDALSSFIKRRMASDVNVNERRVLELSNISGMMIEFSRLAQLASKISSDVSAVSCHTRSGPQAVDLPRTQGVTGLRFNCFKHGRADDTNSPAVKRS